MKPLSAPIFRRGFALFLGLSLWAGTASGFAQRAPKRDSKGSFQKTDRARPTFPSSHPPPGRFNDRPYQNGGAMQRPFTPINARGAGLTRGYVASTNLYNGRPVHGYNGFHASYYWGAPRWYYWTPFHPAFYYSPPIYVNGYYEPGGFSLFRLLLSVALCLLCIGLMLRLFRGGRGGSRYTTYN